jgi:nucleotide-binding universal stress UspA family protein
MLKTMLVGLNGTSYSNTAVEVALAWAQRHQSKLLGLGIVDTPHLVAAEAVPVGGGAFKVERDEIVLKNEEQRLGEVLAKFAEKASAAGVAHHTWQLQGDPAEILVREAQRADLLVMGRSFVPYEFGQSPTNVLQEVLRNTSRPVLCAPAPAEENAAALIAYDGSAPVAKALQMFENLGLAAGRLVHLLTIARDNRDRYPAELAADYLKSRGHEVQMHIETSHAAPATIILGEAQRLHAGVIVMGAFGQSRIREFFFGSLTKTVLQDSKVPLFLYH